jgi:serine/threonine protein kinase
VAEPKNWSKELNTFVTNCLKKDPKDRASTAELLRTSFITKAKGPEVLKEMLEQREKKKKKVSELIHCLFDN